MPNYEGVGSEFVRLEAIANPLHKAQPEDLYTYWIGQAHTCHRDHSVSSALKSFGAHHLEYLEDAVRYREAQQAFAQSVDPNFTESRFNTPGYRPAQFVQSFPPISPTSIPLPPSPHPLYSPTSGSTSGIRPLPRPPGSEAQQSTKLSIFLFPPEAASHISSSASTALPGPALASPLSPHSPPAASPEDPIVMNLAQKSAAVSQSLTWLHADLTTIKGALRLWNQLNPERTAEQDSVYETTRNLCELAIGAVTRNHGHAVRAYRSIPPAVQAACMRADHTPQLQELGPLQSQAKMKQVRHI